MNQQRVGKVHVGHWISNVGAAVTRNAPNGDDMLNKTATF